MKRIYRDRFDKKIGGVCGGLAQYFNFDASIIRLLFVLFTFFSIGITVLIYLALWAVFPLVPRAYIEPHYKRLYRSRRDRRISGICGGLGTYLKVDSNIIRFVVILLLMATLFFPVIISYFVGTAIIPEEPVKYYRK